MLGLGLAGTVTQAWGCPVHWEEAGCVCLRGSWLRASGPGARRRWGSLGTGPLWFHLLYSVVLDVDFGFFYFEIFSLVTQDLVTSSPESCLCVKDNPHPFVCFKCVSDFLPHFLGLTWGTLKTLCGQILLRGKLFFLHWRKE